MFRVIVFVLLAFVNATALAALQVVQPSSFVHPKTSVVIVGGRVDLPSQGQWSVTTHSNAVLGEISLSPPDIIELRSQGKHALEQNEIRQRNDRQYLLSRIYRKLESHARNNEGVAAENLDFLHKQRFYNKEALQHVFLVPSVRILDRNGKPVQSAVIQPLLLDLNPLIDDGKHWVVYSDGSVKLVAIDPHQVKKFGLKIIAQQPSIQQQLAEIKQVASYQISARLTGDVPDNGVIIKLKNSESGQTLLLAWKPQVTQMQDEELVKRWADKRFSQWANMLGDGQSAYLPYWLDAGLRQYDRKYSDLSLAARRNDRRQDDNASLFNVLGGRAAMRETLQLQNLAEDHASAGAVDIPIESIQGVQVQSHPFMQMMAGKKGGSLALADVVPSDHFFAWFADGKALSQYLNAGSDFIFHGGASLSGESNDYHLKQRYFGKLGIDESWAQRFLNSPAVGELAVIMPDLFVLDGTDLTLVMKLQHPKLVKTMLAVLGVPIREQLFEFQHAHGSSYWAVNKGLLLISTHKDEMMRVQAMVAGQGQASLGQSAEFRYMLTQLPIQSKTRSFFYFSDPFIRHLVSPAVKIAQLRRLQAREEMEAASAAWLLYRKRQ